MLIKLSKKKTMRLTSLISLIFALVLVFIKILACLKTGSIALLTSTVDGLVDVLASMITLIGVYYAQQPADQSHRFGHGKAEAIAAFVQALLLIIAGISLGIESLKRFIIPRLLSAQRFGIIIIVISTFCAILLVIIQTYVIRYTKSTAISADRAHYFVDIMVNITVLFVLFFEYKFNWIRADASGAFIISCYIIWNSFNIVKLSMLQLLDRELDSIDRCRIIKTILTCPGIEGVHDLRTRNGGDKVFIEMHIEVNGRLTVNAAHFICESVESSVKELFSSADVFVHLEPSGILDKRLDDIIK